MAEEASSGSSAASRKGGNGDGGTREEQMVSAPSLGPNTVINRESVEDRLARHDQSEVDAMGKDKRRSVVGHRHGPSKVRQLALYGVALVVLVGVFVGGLFLIGKADKPVDKVPNTAPWSKADARQIQPKPIQ